MLSQTIDIIRIARTRRAELKGDFVGAQERISKYRFASDRYRRFSEAYLAKLMVVNHDNAADSFIEKMMKKREEFLKVGDGSYYADYLIYLQAVLHNDH